MNKKTYRPFPQYVPTDGQACYVVRFVRGADALQATFNLSLWEFTSPLTASPILAWDVVEWRPQ